jgi:hypothetical protein
MRFFRLQAAEFETSKRCATLLVVEGFLFGWLALRDAPQSHVRYGFVIEAAPDTLIGILQPVVKLLSANVAGTGRHPA